MKWFSNILVVLLLFFTPYVTGQELNKDSIYHFDSSWLDQNSEEIKITELQGEVRLLAFVYTYCEHTCPLIITQIKSILKALPDQAKNRVQVTLITLDPKRDTPKQLKAYMEKHQLNENLWTMLTGDPSDIRVLSNLVGVKYKAMQKGELAHSNMITLLDSEGVIQYQIKGLNQDKSELIKRIVELKTE